MSKAVINKIIYNTFIDGPGSRIAVFLQGCNMKCQYCHNPETQNCCSACGKCIDGCPVKALAKFNNKITYNKDTCISCDNCIKNCPSNSSPKVIELDVEEMYRIIIGYSDFIDGITFSGGECTIQYEFIEELFTKIKRDTELTTFIDTNGYLDSSLFLQLCKVTDGFMIDLKTLDNHKHKELTGADNKIILNNIKTAAELGLLYEIRTVIVQGFTDDKRCIRDISRFIKSLNDYTIFKLIPFRPMGVKGYLSNFPPLDDTLYNMLYETAYEILDNRVRKTI